MSEIVLKVRDGSGYQDGDILAAFSRLAIRSVHAQHLCHPHLAKKTPDGMLVAGDHCEKFFLLTHQFRFARVSYSEVIRKTLATGDEILISDKPAEIDGKMQAIDAEGFIERRRAVRHSDGRILRPMFGAPGREVWFGGKIDLSDQVMSQVWEAIQLHSGQRENQLPYRNWPLTAQEKRSHLALKMNLDFDEQAASRLVSPDIDDTGSEPVVIAKRKNMVHWKESLRLHSRDIESVEDCSQEFDIRCDREFSCEEIVKPKQDP